MINLDEQENTPAQVLSSPALLFLYHRIDKILGIKAAYDSLQKLNEYLENRASDTFINNPAAFENILTSRENIFEIAGLLTVNETYFFREGAHFILLSQLLSEFSKSGSDIYILSAATSIGCEAYSIAMLIEDLVKKGLSLNYHIDAFDVSLESIETAKNACYGANTMRNESLAWKHILDSYVIQNGCDFTVMPEIRQKVNFFTHNIMRGLNRQYDIIFFRNALIYFSSKNRQIILDDFASNLSHNGYLILGASETSSVQHPLLHNKNTSDAFYFQKNLYSQKTSPNAPIIRAAAEKKHFKPVSEKGPSHEEHQKIPVNHKELITALAAEDGNISASRTLEALKNIKKSSKCACAVSDNTLSGANLAFCAFHYLDTQDFDSAQFILSFLETHDSGSVTQFLRGEYQYLSNNHKKALEYYEDSAVKDRAFWPSFYRIATLSEEGNHTRYSHKIKKACESIALGTDLQYEYFLGGFSPDYYRIILEKKLLTANKGHL
jgi:chemotaxis protein methyltransferase CheR